MKIGPSGVWAILRQTTSEWNEDKAPLLGAALAFYTALSIAPLLVITLAILVGHSIGGMITLTVCKLFPKLLSGPVVGISIVHSTYTNSLRTTRFASFLTAIQRPFIEPLLSMTVFLSPLAWLMNGLSYLNGSAQKQRHILASRKRRNHHPLRGIDQSRKSRRTLPANNLRFTGTCRMMPTNRESAPCRLIAPIARERLSTEF